MDGLGDVRCFEATLLVSHIFAFFGVLKSEMSNVSAHKFLCETFNSLLSVSSSVFFFFFLVTFHYESLSFSFWA